MNPIGALGFDNLKFLRKKISSGEREVVVLLQRSLKNYAIWIFFFKCVELGTKYKHFEKKNSKSIDIGSISALWKRFEKKKLCMGRFSFLVKNF